MQAKESSANVTLHYSSRGKSDSLLSVETVCHFWLQHQAFFAASGLQPQMQMICRARLC